MESTITKNYKRRRNIALLIDILLFMGTCGFLVIYGFLTKFKMTTETETNQIADAVVAVYGVLLISFLIGGIIVFFIKNKARNTVWMANLILSVYLFGTTGMWFVLAIWALDEFVVLQLFKHYREKTSINKEIDKRL